MIIKSLYSNGILDLSGNLEGDYYPLFLKPGETKTISDIYAKLSSVQSAASSSLIQILSYDSSSSSTVVQAELNLKANSSDLLPIQSQLNLKANSSSLSKVATSGAYNDLSGKPDLSDLHSASTLGTKTIDETDIGDGKIIVYNSLSGNLEYEELSDNDASTVWGNITGTLSDQTDLNTALGDKADSSSLSAVATSGDYDDLSNLPDLSDLHSASTLGTKTIDETDIGDGKVIAYNASSGNLEYETISVDNDAAAVWGNITGDLSSQTDLNTALGNKANSSSLSEVATSGEYNDLNNKPDLSDLHTASTLGTKTIDETDIGDGKVIAYNSSSGDLEYVEQSGGSGSGIDMDSWTESDDEEFLKADITKDYELSLPSITAGVYWKAENAATDEVSRHTISPSNGAYSQVWAVGDYSYKGGSVNISGNMNDFWFDTTDDFTMTFVVKCSSGVVSVDCYDEMWMNPWSIYLDFDTDEIMWGMMGANWEESCGLSTTEANRIEIARSSGTVKLFVNGSQVASYADSSEWGYTVGYDYGGEMYNDNPTFSIASNANAYIDEFAVIKGTAWHTSTYTAYGLVKAVSLSGYSVNDSGTTASDLWSADKIQTELDEKASRAIINDITNPGGENFVRSAEYIDHHAFIDSAEELVVADNTKILEAVHYDPNTGGTSDWASTTVPRRIPPPWLESSSPVIYMDWDAVSGYGGEKLTQPGSGDYTYEIDRSVDFTAWKKPGGSLKISSISGVSDPIYRPGYYIESNNGVCAFGTNDFSIEFICRFDGLDGGSNSTTQPGGVLSYRQNPEKGTAYSWTVGLGHSSAEGGIAELEFVCSAAHYRVTYAAGGWQPASYHICIERISNVLYFAVNGTIKGTAACSADILPVVNPVLNLVGPLPMQFVAGGTNHVWYDSLRIVKGSAPRELDVVNGGSGNFNIWNIEKRYTVSDTHLHNVYPTWTDVTDTYSADIGELLVCNKATAFTVTLPENHSKGDIIKIKNIGAGDVTVDGYSSQTIDGSSDITVSQWAKSTLISDGTNWLTI